LTWENAHKFDMDTFAISGGNMIPPVLSMIDAMMNKRHSQKRTKAYKINDVRILRRRYLTITTRSPTKNDNEDEDDRERYRHIG